MSKRLWTRVPELKTNYDNSACKYSLSLLLEFVGCYIDEGMLARTCSCPSTPAKKPLFHYSDDDTLRVEES